MIVTISKVLHPETGAVLAFEVVANDGSVYFATLSSFMEGLRVGPYPNGKLDLRLERVEIARLE